MIQVTDQFAALIDTAPSQLQLTLADGTAINPKAVKSAEWIGGSNSGDDITLGSTVAIQLTADLDRQELGAIALADARMRAELILTAEEEIVQIPWGVLQVEKPESDDDSVTITAGDAMLWAFSAEYALDDAELGFDWEAGVDGETLLKAICSACGVVLGTTGLRPITLSHVSPAGYTYREIIAFLACMWGRFARIDGEGRLVLQWYAAVDRPILPSRYYSGELVKADYSYTVEYIKCYAEVLEETLEVGDTTKSQGIYIKCPWMTQECLQEVWEEIGGFNYRPVSELRFLGDPRLEPGDVIQVTDLDGTVYSVPCMTLRHEFDGGLISEVTAVGKSVSASEKDYQGPVTRQIERAVSGIKATVVKTETEIRQEVADVDGRLVSLTTDVEGIEGRVQSTEDDLSVVKQTAGEVSVEVSDENGTLTTLINSDAWKAWFTNADGEEKSGIHFDFEKGRFVFNGTGQFGGVNDGDTYIAVDGKDVCVYDTADNVVMRLGVKIMPTEATWEFPYIGMTTRWFSGSLASEDTLIIRNPHGLWVGNGHISLYDPGDGSMTSINSLGIYTNEYSAGLFISSWTPRVYLIAGKTYTELYTGDTIARFG